MIISQKNSINRNESGVFSKWSSQLLLLGILFAILAYIQFSFSHKAYASSWTASVGFSTTTQGANQWYYQQRAIGTNTFTNLTFVSGSWRNGSTNEPWIGPNNFHPDNSYDAVRTWVAPSTGTISITGRAYKIDTSAGNGVIVSVLKNTTSIWTHTIAYNDSTGYTTDASLSSISVTAGDSIRFIVNNNGNWGADETGWDPNISYVTPNSWTASNGFSNIQGLNQWYYQQRAIGTNTYTNTTFSTGNWRGASGNWVYDHNAHPDNSYDAVRTWVAPTTGTVSIKGRAFKIDTSAGNGVVVSVVKNTTSLWSQTIAYNDTTGYTTDSALSSVSVTAGDSIRFVVNNNGEWSADETGWDPTVAYVSAGPNAYISSLGFSSTQGQNQWYYQQRAIGTNTYTNISFSSGAWRGGSGNWIGGYNTHPDNSYDAVRTWVAPRAGNVSITGRVFKINITDGGNGIVATVLKNNTSLWTSTIAADDWAGRHTDDALANVSVAAGDSIHFVVNNNGDYGADETGWDPEVTYLSTPPTNTTYYVSASGSNSNSGTDSSHPWQTVTPLNNIRNFGSGVQILFHGGDTIAGGLNISMVGTSGSRDVIGSYGTGKATLTDVSAPTTNIIQLANSEYLTIQNLNLIATPGTNYGKLSFVPVNKSNGIEIYSTRTSGTKWRSIYVDNMNFEYSLRGLWVNAMETSTVDGYDDLKLTNSTFDKVYNLGAAIYGFDPYGSGAVNQNTNVYFGTSKYNNITGDPNFPFEAGAIQIGNTTGTIIEKNLMSTIGGNGGYSPIGGSTALGITNTRNFKVLYNEVAGTKSSTPYDGSGLDADHNTQNGEIAYNLTYNNGGPGIMAGSFGGVNASNIAIHHNVSYNDARGNTSSSQQGAIRFWGSTDHIQFFNNTVYVDQSGSIGTPSALSFENSNSSFKAWNNIFKTTSGMPMVRPNSGTHINTDAQFIANLYDSSGSSLLISTDDTHGSYTNVTTLSGWQGFGQEKISSTLYGVVANAGLTSLTAPSGYLPASQVSAFTSFDLTSGSAARGHANNPWSIITETSPITVQTFDYHGNTGSTIDIGADTY